MDGMTALDSIAAKAAMSVCVEQLQSLTAQRTAARYAFHKVTVHKYAQAALRQEMPIELAWRHYDEAMRNYDGIIESAANGASQDMNAAEMAKRSAAIDEAVAGAR